MYLGIDIGGTKTLLAVFSQSGELKLSYKFPTNPDYEQFKLDLVQSIKEQLGQYQFTQCCCAAPGRVDRDKGVAIGFGNLGWSNTPIKPDLEKLLGIPVVVENDANLAGLSEAQLVREKYNKVLYITISTGIGDGIIIDGVIDQSLADSEAGHMILEHDGISEIWEHFASGKAILAKYGKIAADIDDPEIWKVISKNISRGLIDIIATIQPDVVIIGGGVGTHFHKYGKFLNEELQNYKAEVGSVVNIPLVIGAQRPEDAVIYGCYELIRQKLETNPSTNI